jgi:hypothetical protein
MSNTYAEQAHPIADLAADLTDLALEALGPARAGDDSVSTELELWRALTLELEREMRWRRFAPRDDSDPDGAAEQLVRRAVLRVAAELAPGLRPAELVERTRPAVAALRVPEQLRAALAGLFTRPAAGRRPLGESGLSRQLQLTSLN